MNTQGFFESIKPIKDKTRVSPRKQKYLELKLDYEPFASFIGLQPQKTRLKYNDWKNSDISKEELVESLSINDLRQLCRDGGLLKENVSEDIYNSDPKLAKDLLYHIFRLIYKHYSIISIFSRSSPEVFLNKRNKIVVKDVVQTFEKEPDQELGVIYGGGHIPGIVNYLRREDFRRDNVEWIKAVDFNPEDSLLKSLWKLFMHYHRVDKKETD